MRARDEIEADLDVMRNPRHDEAHPDWVYRADAPARLLSDVEPLLAALGVAEAALARVTTELAKHVPDSCGEECDECGHPWLKTKGGCIVRRTLVGLWSPVAPAPEPPVMSEHAANALADLILTDAEARGDAPEPERGNNR
jgi:hypothetical protein